jgi:hypothetical protein
MDQQQLQARQQRASDYFLENERLTRDLTDDQAQVLVIWASQQASSYAGDPAHSDAQVEAHLLALRSAVLHVARSAPTEHDPQCLVALAAQALDHAAEA